MPTALGPRPSRSLISQAPDGFRIAAAAPSGVPVGASLSRRRDRGRRRVLYLVWPAEGWIRGTVARRSRPARFSHVGTVRYDRA